MKIRKNYQYDVMPGEKFNEPSMTQQHFKDECDVNQILKKYQNTGLIEHVNHTPGTYGDVSEYDAADYQRAMNIVIDAQERFDALPSAVRKKFDNDPAKFLQYAMDASTREDGHQTAKLNTSGEPPAAEVKGTTLAAEEPPA